MSSSLSLRRRIMAVLCGGFCGTIARYLLSLFIQSHLGKAWPYDILLINVTGAFLLALITTLADATILIGPTRRLFINVGFLGAYTTFSSLALGDVLLFSSGQWLPALLYLAASLVGGMLAVLLGSWFGQWCISRVRSAARTRPSQSKTEALVPQTLDEVDVLSNRHRSVNH
ncbi:MAG: fluoride efflux transporter CrcB [Chloroflexi bacterium]|nr:fluoride efflux transporter CrcB [Chloroflexota bacterium]